MNDTVQTLSGRIVPENNHIRIPKLPGYCTGLINRLTDQYWERRFAVKTSGRREIHYRDAMRYEAVPYYVYFKIFDRVGLAGDDVVVDLGSGEGRMVCAAASYPVRSVVGVEIDPELHAIAADNLEKMRYRKAPVRLLCQSASDFDFEDVTIVCLFNPFGASTMSEVLEHLKKSLQLHPRTVKIVYLNAVCKDLFAATPWLELVEQWKMASWSRIKTPVHFYLTKKV